MSADIDKAVERLLQAAKVYSFNYMQDEADSAEDCVCGPEQHAEAVEVFAAIAEVEKARADVARLVALSGKGDAAAWISVDQDLPEVETDVLVYGKRRDSICYSVAGIFNGNTYAVPGMLTRKEWMAQDSEQELRFEVSHWMPLPATPQTAPIQAKSEGGAK